MRELYQKLCALHHADVDPLHLLDRTGRPAKLDKIPRPMDRMSDFTHEIPKSLLNPLYGGKFQILRQELTDKVLKDEMEFINSLRPSEAYMRR